MSGAKPARRELDFRSFREARDEVARLRREGYEQAGNWDLAQVCGHLADWLRYPVEGFPMRRLPWLARATVGRWFGNRILRTRKMPSVKTGAKASVHPPGEDLDANVAALERAIRRYESHAEPLAPSPVFHNLTREQYDQIQLIHCAHHLSFLVPKG